MTKRTGNDSPADNKPEAGSQSTAQPFKVVGIGASAGGLKALKTLFAALPPNPGVPFVVVMHLSPEHKSHLPELLQPHCPMPVQQVAETVPLERNRVYVIPPNANLDAVDTHLRLSTLEERRPERAPIDHFFHTLAETSDGQAVGIVLTGTGADGTLGLRRIKERGGVTIAQDPVEAEYDGMPRSAIASGAADLVLPLADIASRIVEMARIQPHLPPEEQMFDPRADDNRILNKIFAHVRSQTGHDFSEYKRSTIMRRIGRRMQLHRLQELSDYLLLLRDDRGEITALFDELLITVTEFFRDAEIFARLQAQVLPRLFEGRIPQDAIRIWSVGCATGEEAYSLAMLMLEEAARRDGFPQMQIFATDLHARSLRAAREGVYPDSIAADVSPERLRRFFIGENGTYRVRKEVRELVIFAEHNLLKDPPFSHLDLIVCRNVLIYLQRDVQEDVAALFHYALDPNGLLLLGTAETIEGSDLFECEDKALGLYRRRSVPTREPRLPVFPYTNHSERDAEPPPARAAHWVSYGAIHAKMVEQYAPPSILVNDNHEVVHYSAQAGRFLQIPGGEPTNNVFKLVSEPLRVELRSALHAAKEMGRMIQSKPLELGDGPERRPVVLRVRPPGAQGTSGFFLVIFDEVEEPRTNAEAVDNSHTLATVQELEAEVELYKQRLQSIIEEYETTQEEMRASNEELQSTNEELRSTMEELETSKEELQSMNEELATVNQENRHRVEELSQLSGDLHNLLTATDIATLFLDRELRIVRYTQQVGELFNIRNSDKGRPLSDLTHRLADSDLQADARRVLDRLLPVEREVESEAGGWYLVRILPYRASDDRIDGVVITFIDITARKQVEEALRASEEQLAAELAAVSRLHESVARLLVSSDLQLALEEVLVAAIEITGADFGHIQLLNQQTGLMEIAAQRGFGPPFLEHFRTVGSDDTSSYGRAMLSKKRVVVEDVESDRQFERHREIAAEAGYRAVQSTPLLSRQDALLGMLSTHYRQPRRPMERDTRILDLYARQAADFIENFRSREALEIADRRKDEFLATLAHELRNPLAPIVAGLEVLKLASRQPDVVDDVRGTMERQTQQLVRLVDDLLDVSRIAGGRLHLRKAATELAPIVREAVTAVQPFINEVSQELQVALPERPIVLSVDPARLNQVLCNLLTNASKYTPPHGRIWLTIRNEGDDVAICVKDSGIGIAPEMFDHIFEMFAQIDHQTDTGQMGLGIGLTLVKSIVQMHGGTIAVQSAGRDQGSEFIVRLPILETGARVAPAPAARQPEAAKRRRILIVDDNEAALRMLSILVEKLGNDVRLAHHGVEALEVAKAFRPEIMFLDLGMPKMSGYEVAQAVRQESWGKQVSLVALTGWGQAEDRRRTKQAGFDFHLIKPADVAAIQDVLNRADRAEG